MSMFLASYSASHMIHPRVSVLTADSTTLKLDSQKNGWQVALPTPCACSPLPLPYIHLRNMGADSNTFLLAHNDDEGWHGDVTNKVVSKPKVAARAQDYPTAKEIPVHCISTHSLWSGCANAQCPLLYGLLGYPHSKDGAVARGTFKEYIREELVCFSKGMSRHMTKKFDFVNIADNAFNIITDIRYYWWSPLQGIWNKCLHGLGRIGIDKIHVTLSAIRYMRSVTKGLDDAASQSACWAVTNNLM